MASKKKTKKVLLLSAAAVVAVYVSFLFFIVPVLKRNVVIWCTLCLPGARGFKFRRLYKYVQAQAKHETGNYTSNLYRNGHNMFGMHFPRVRPTVADRGALDTTDAVGAGLDWAVYKSDYLSVIDFLLWWEFSRGPVSFSSVESYVAFLKSKGYFTAGEQAYVNGMKRFL